MRNFTKVSALILSMLITFSTVPSLASDIENETSGNNDVIEITQPQPFYSSFTGTVKELDDSKEGVIRAFVENKDGMQANFILSNNTYYVDNIKIEEGTEITGYYESGRPMILIYPPQYTIDIVTPVFNDVNIKADKFNGDLLSADKTLKLNISEDTEILWENGTQIYWFAKPSISDLETALSNRKLIVFYDFTTKSIPAQTTPNKIIVLSQQVDDSIINIIVDDKIIDSPAAYISEEGVVMVPIRRIAEALGYEVSWNNEEKSVQIGNEITIKIGETSCSVSGKAPFELEAAPILNTNSTYVPLSFFKETEIVKEANFIENNIMISSGRVINN